MFHEVNLQTAENSFEGLRTGFDWKPRSLTDLLNQHNEKRLGQGRDRAEEGARTLQDLISFFSTATKD